MKNANWIVALLVGGALGIVGGSACTKPGAASRGPSMANDQGKSPANLPPGYLKETDLPAGTLAGLSEQQKYSVLKAINEKPCNCGCSNDTIAKCRKNDPTCTTSPKLIDQAITLAKQGQSATQIEAAFGGGAGPGKGQKGPQEDLAYYRVPIGNSPTEGPATAKVTIVEATDFQWPFCGRVGPTLKELQKKYGNDLRIVLKLNPLPFHNFAAGAAEAAMAANAQGKFWPMHDLLFAHQQGGLDRAHLDGYAKELGLNTEKFKHDLDTNAYAAEIKQDQDLMAQLGMGGTPAFFINGKKLSGAQPVASFEKIIDAELQHANQLIAQGIKPDDVYAEIMKTARTSPAPSAAAQNQPRQPPPAQVRKVELGDAYVKGPKDAKVTILEFSDFQWPYCSRVGPTLKQIEAQYPHDVRIAFRNEPLPFHPNAMPAAEAAAAAGAQGKFWQMHDLLFANQRDLGAASYEKWAQQLGLDLAKFKADLASHKYEAQLKADAAYAGSVGASGTPNFFIDGRQIVGAQPFEAFKKIIDEEIVKADALLKKGVKPSKLYEAELEENLKNQPTTAAAPSPGGPPAPTERKIVDIGRSPVLGSPRAPVTLVEFSDFQWPFCSRVGPTLKQIEKEYEGKVKVVWKNQPLPFHPNALPAAKAAMAANEQGKFWQMEDLLFANQRDLGDATYEKFAKQLGLNMEKFKADMASPKVADEIAADSKEGQALGANGTPTFFINGRQLVGAQPFEQFKQVIDEELKSADKRVATKHPGHKRG